MGYDMFISPKERENTYVTGLIAFKKDEFVLEHTEQINYNVFIREYVEKGKTLGLNDLAFQYQFAIILRHIETQTLMIVTNSHFHPTPAADFFKFYEAHLTLHLVEKTKKWAIANKLAKEDNKE